MKTRTTCLLSLVLACAIAGLSATAWAKGPGGGGGPSKVEVTAADPAETEQGQELDVVITGSGFDEGSTATWFVTGTSDDSQVQVLENEYLPSTGQLRARIRVQDAATVTDYDIEVRNSSGRRGKGTTLFRVKEKVDETACTGLEEKDPTIAYLTGPELRNDINSWDIMLSSESGCDQSVLLLDAQQVLPDTKENEGINRSIRSVDDLRFAAQAGRGIVVWIDTSPDPVIQPWEVWGIAFSYDSSGIVFTDTVDSVLLHSAPDGRSVVDLDVRLNGQLNPELVMTEGLLGGDERDAAVTVLNTATGAYEVVWRGGAGECLLIDEGVCYRPRYCCISWGETGDELFFSPQNPDNIDNSVIARSWKETDGLWGTPQMVMRQGPGDINLDMRSILIGQLLFYEVLREQINRGGKVVGRERVYSLIDVRSQCASEACIPTDGQEVQGTWHAGKWSKDGRLIYAERQPNDGWTLRELSDPVNGVQGSLAITEVANEFDTSK